MSEQHRHTIISFRGVDFSFPGGKALFHNLSLDLKPHQFYLVQGPSGAGKSTFLKLINRLEEPSGGRILFKGRPLASYDPTRLRRSILYIQQTPTAIDASVRDNLLLPFAFKKNHDLQKPDDTLLEKRLTDFLLSDIRLSDHAQTLSVGQLQRLCFIRGLLLSPEMLLLDEPASSLDAESERVVQDTAEKLCTESGLTVMMVSHREYIHRSINTRTIEVADGTIKEHE